MHGVRLDVVIWCVACLPPTRNLYYFLVALQGQAFTHPHGVAHMEGTRVVCALEWVWTGPRLLLRAFLLLWIIFCLFLAQGLCSLTEFENCFSKKEQTSVINPGIWSMRATLYEYWKHCKEREKLNIGPRFIEGSMPGRVKLHVQPHSVQWALSMQ